MCKISKTSKEIEILENAVIFLDEKLFDNLLSKIKLTISPDKGKNATYGWAMQNSWKNATETYHELNITSNQLNRKFSEIWVTLVHELIHIYGYCQKIETVSRQGRYHGKKFKELCDKFHLVTAKDNKIGYVTPHDLFLPRQQELYNEFTQNLNLNELFNLNRNLETETTKPKKQTNFKYTCLSCLSFVRGKKGLNIMCSDCDCYFEMEEEEN